MRRVRENSGVAVSGRMLDNCNFVVCKVDEFSDSNLFPVTCKTLVM